MQGNGRIWASFLGHRDLERRNKRETATIGKRIASTSAQLRNGTIRRYKSADSFWWIFRDVLGMLLKIGFGTISRAGGQMNAVKYIELLQDTVLPELAAAGRPMVFMQDNAPCHRQRL